MSKKTRKTEPGDAFLTLIAAVLWIHSGKWVYIDDKPVNCYWAIHFSVAKIRTLVRYRSIRRCMDAKTGNPYTNTIPHETKPIL